MTQLLLARENLKNFIGKYEIYLKPLGKFLLALVALIMINATTGYMSALDSAAVVLVVALACSFMPLNFIVICSAIFIVAHFYALSMECALVVGILFLVMALLYFRFSSRDTLIVLLLPIFFVLKIPYVIPICVGLYAAPVSALSVACGVISYYAIDYVVANETELGALESEDMSSRFKYVIDGIINNKAMLIVMITFVITVILVYTIRRLSVDHSWTVAIITGTIVQMVILLMGDLMFDSEISVIGILIGSILAVGAAKVLEFLVFNLDYNRTELVQFEDDEYYYYVKAVPKITVARTTKTVKKINTQNRRRHVTED